MRTWDSPLRSVRSAAFLSGAAAVLLSVNSVLNDFAFDDLPVVIQNTSIQDLGTLPKALVSPYWPNEYGQDLGLWRPLTTAFYGIQWAFWGENPAMFHALNVVLHGVVTALVVVVLAELVPLGLAFVAGLLFAVHPVHVEAVANVVGLAEVLSSALYLGACLVFLRAGHRITLLRGATITLGSLDTEPGRDRQVGLYWAMDPVARYSAAHGGSSRVASLHGWKPAVW